MWCHCRTISSERTQTKKTSPQQGNRPSVGRAWETKNGWIWWETKRKARERIPQKNEERTKCSRLTWRLQISLY